ncbi:MAG: hypothetical protein IT379_14415 [Deltaproteobacteria bacterium]|nr:hypothetical protein [Deltaproteobacteria bacterium]
MSASAGDDGTRSCGVVVGGGALVRLLRALVASLALLPACQDAALESVDSGPDADATARDGATSSPDAHDDGDAARSDGDAPRDAAPHDAGSFDATPARDASEADTGTPPVDSGPASDAAPTFPRCALDAPEGCEIVDVQAGGRQTCVLRRSGAVWCFGSNACLQLGREAPDPAGARAIGCLGDFVTSDPVPGIVPDVSRVVVLSVGGYHACVLDASDTTRCWGRNHELAAGGAEATSYLTPVRARVAATTLSVANSLSCATDLDGAALCWGENGRGELGRGTTSFAESMPANAGTLVGLREVGAGYFMGCAIDARDTWCWGHSLQLFLPVDVVEASSPVRIESAPPFDAIRAGDGYACGLGADGSIHCFGRDERGELGDGEGRASSSVPIEILAPGQARALDVFFHHACAVRTDGRVVCWGANEHGQLGDGTTVDRAAPVEVGGIADAVGVSVGFYHSCALVRGGEVWCWGHDGQGQLGAGDGEDHPTPVAAPALAPTD